MAITNQLARKGTEKLMNKVDKWLPGKKEHEQNIKEILSRSKKNYKWKR